MTVLRKTQVICFWSNKVLENVEETKYNINLTDDVIDMSNELRNLVIIFYQYSYFDEHPVKKLGIT